MGVLRLLLWDVKDTLLRVRRTVGHQYSQEALRLGLQLPPAEVETAFRHAHRHHSVASPNYGAAQNLGGKSWWSAVVRDTFSQCGVQDKELLDRLANNLYLGFSGPDNWEVFHDAEETLKCCASLGLQQAVVSNFDSRLGEILHGCGLLPYFSFLVTSEEAGVPKPHPAIFQRALQKSGIPAAQVAHVGDSYINDYLAARSLGIHGFLLERQPIGSALSVPAAHRLQSLNELPARLQKNMETVG